MTYFCSNSHRTLQHKKLTLMYVNFRRLEYPGKNADCDEVISLYYKCMKNLLKWEGEDELTKVILEKTEGQINCTEVLYLQSCFSDEGTR